MASRMHFFISQPAVTVAPNDLVGKLIAAYKTDVYFRKKSNTISLHYLKDFGGKRIRLLFPIMTCSTPYLLARV